MKSVRLDPDLAARLREAARAAGVTESKLMRDRLPSGAMPSWAAGWIGAWPTFLAWSRAKVVVLADLIVASPKS